MNVNPHGSVCGSVCSMYYYYYSNFMNKYHYAKNVSSPGDEGAVDRLQSTSRLLEAVSITIFYEIASALDLSVPIFRYFCCSFATSRKCHRPSIFTSHYQSRGSSGSSGEQAKQSHLIRITYFTCKGTHVAWSLRSLFDWWPGSFPVLFYIEAHKGSQQAECNTIDKKED